MIPLNTSKIRVPLVADWKPFVVAGANQSAPKVNLQFKPQGTLLKVKLSNKIPLDRLGRPPKANIALSFSSTQLQHGTLDFSPMSGTPSGKPYIFSRLSDVAFEKTISLNNFDSSRALVIWGMPTTGIGTSTVKVHHFKMSHNAVMSSQTQARYPISQYNGFSRSSDFKSGYAYYVATDLVDYKQPLDFFAEYDIADNTFSSFRPDNLALDPQSNAQYYKSYITRAERDNMSASDKFFTIGGEDYVIPSMEQYKAVAPSDRILHILNPTITTPSNITYAMSVPNLWATGQISDATVEQVGTIPLHSVWKLKIDKFTAFAIAHAENNSYNSGAYLSAYRYKFRDVGTTGGGISTASRPTSVRLEVKAVFIGRDANIPSIDQLTDEWFDARAGITRVFALKGFTTNIPSAAGYKQIGDYWARQTIAIAPENRFFQTIFFDASDMRSWINNQAHSSEASQHRFVLRPYKKR